MTPLGIFIPTPTPTKCIQSTPHTIPLNEYIIHSSLPPSHPFSEPLSLTQLNGSNSSKNAYFQTQWPPWFFLYRRLPQPNVSKQRPTSYLYMNILFIPLSLYPTQSLSPCPWPLWMARMVPKLHISRPNDPPGYFYANANPYPYQTYPVNSSHHPPKRIYNLILSPFIPLNFWALVLYPSEWLK